MGLSSNKTNFRLSIKGYLNFSIMDQLPPPLGHATNYVSHEDPHPHLQTHCYLLPLDQTGLDGAHAKVSDALVMMQVLVTT